MENEKSAVPYAQRRAEEISGQPTEAESAVVANPNTAWLRELTVSDIFLFSLKALGAGILLAAVLAIPILAIMGIFKF